MGQLERSIAAPSALPGRIAELVAELPSVSVQAPRTLDPVLLSRLEEIAAQHGGKVPIHGRLFSQWMHHAYPLECPFPHEAGSINPQTVDEWLRDSGSASETSDEERQRVVEGDVCAVNWEGKVECGDEETDLPWSLAEELLTGPEEAHDADAATCAPCAAALLLLVAALAALAAARHQGHASVQELVASVRSSKSASVLAVLLLITVAFLAGLVNGASLGLAFVASFAFFVASQRSARMHDKGMFLPKHAKVCV